MILITKFANENKRKFANMHEDRQKPKSERKNQEIELVKKLIAQSKDFLPNFYVEDVLAEFCKKNTVPEDKIQSTKRAIRDTVNGKSHKIDIAHAIFSIAMAYKAKFEETEELLKKS